MNEPNQHTDAQERAANLPANTEPGESWQEIEPGRFMPRRVRGSFRGHALG